MAKVKVNYGKYAPVQHSGASHDAGFKRGLEEAAVTEAEALRIVASGGVVFETYVECSDYCMREMYPPGVDGLYPFAPGTFGPEIQGRRRRIYLPAPKPTRVTS